MSEQVSSELNRRGFLGVCFGAGLGQTLLPGALFTLATQAKAQSSPIVGGGEVKANTEAMAKITPEMIDAAAVIAGISVTDEQKKMMLEGLEQLRKSYTAIRDLKMPNSVAPAFVFDPVPGDMVLDTVKKPLKMSAAPECEDAGGGCVGGSCGRFGLAGVCFGAGAGGAGQDAKDYCGRTDEDVFGTAEEV